jgi:hypothetical protein
MSRPHCLVHVGILDLLHNDDRPTFVLGPPTTHVSSNQQHELVFTNSALEHFLTTHTQPEAFKSWSQSLTVGPEESDKKWTFAGRTWNCTLVGGVWQVIYCAQPESAEQERQRLAPAVDRLQANHVNTVEPPNWDILVPPVGESAKLLDWTRFHVPDLSPHIMLIKNFDWSSTPLGPIHLWPSRLSSMVLSICTNPDPRVIVWGEALTMIYNEPCAPRLGEKHPQAIGQSAAEIYSEIWPRMSELFRPAIMHGQAMKSTEELMFHQRNGIFEETYWYVQ